MPILQTVWEMLYDNLRGLARVAIVGVMAYAWLVLLLRISGKRTLAKMNAFDWIVSVAMGSTLATTLLSEDVALFEGMLAFAVLVGLQFAVAWSSVRSRTFNRMVKSEPRMLLYRGRFLQDAMRRERVGEAEIRQAIRSNGSADLENVAAVVLETDGTFAIVTEMRREDPSAMVDVNAPRAPHVGRWTPDQPPAQDE